MLRARTATLLLLLSTQPAVFVGTAEQSGIVVGEVVDAKTNAAMPDARVSLRPILTERPAPGTRASTVDEKSALTSADGSFTIADVRPGEYRLQAAKPGFTGGLLGQSSPVGTQTHLVIKGGETIRVRLALWKGIQLSGRVQLPGGEPAASYVVHAIRLMSTRPIVAGVVVTAPDGSYVMENMFPGKYWIAVASGRLWFPAQAAFPMRTPAPVLFHPAGRLPTEAEEVSLIAGQDKQLDVRMNAGSTLSRISGRLIGGGAAKRCPTARLVIAFSEADALASPIEFATAPVSSAGTFAFEQIPDGSYFVRGVCQPAGIKSFWPVHDRYGFLTSHAKVPETAAPEQSYWFSEAIRVSGKSIEGLPVAVQPGVRVTGSVTISPGSTVDFASLAGAPVSAFPVSGWNLEDLPSGVMRRDGTFVGPFLPPGRFVIGPYSDSGFYTERALVGGRDITDQGVEVGSSDMSGVTLTLTTRRSVVTGTVRDDKSLPRPDATIYVFPTDRRRWMPLTMATFRSDPTGAYSLRLGSGEFFIAATADEPIGPWREKQFLDSLIPGASRVAITAGDTRSLTLVVQSVRDPR